MTDHSDALLRCDVGGGYQYGGDRAVYQERCGQPPTHRYQGTGFVKGHWSYRCAEHEKWLDRSVCMIERL